MKATKAIAKPTPLSTRIVCGAVAGFVATAPMTAVMHRLHRRLRRNDKYPLPPREIVGATLPEITDESATNATLLAHFAYGALSGAALSAVIEKPAIGKGIAGGLSIWLASYMGWIPVFGILKPATRHPDERNGLMIIAHVAWGATYALAERDLVRSSRRAFAEGPLTDKARKRRNVGLGVKSGR